MYARSWFSSWERSVFCWQLAVDGEVQRDDKTNLNDGVRVGRRPRVDGLSLVAGSHDGRLLWAD